MRHGPTRRDVLDVLGAPDAKSLLPEIVEGTQVAGSLTPEAAALTGLKAGTPITLGYVDVLCTGLGGGLYDPGARRAAPSWAPPACT